MVKKKSISQLANEYATVSSFDPFETLKLAGPCAATMPEFISALDPYGKLWNEYGNYITRSEEHLGTDIEGNNYLMILLKILFLKIF